MTSTYSMEHSPSLEANRFSASQEIPSNKLDGLLPQSQGNAGCHFTEPDQSSPCLHPTSWRSILILFSHRRLGLPRGLLPSEFPIKTLYASLPSLPAHISFFLTYSLQSYFVKSLYYTAHHYVVLPASCYLVSFKPKYLPQPVFATHSSLFFVPQCEKLSLTLIQNKRKYYNSVYFNLYILDNKLEEKDSAPNDSTYSPILICF